MNGEGQTQANIKIIILCVLTSVQIQFPGISSKLFLTGSGSQSWTELACFYFHQVLWKMSKFYLFPEYFLAFMFHCTEI